MPPYLQDAGFLVARALACYLLSPYSRSTVLLSRMCQNAVTDFRLGRGRRAATETSAVIFGRSKEALRYLIAAYVASATKTDDTETVTGWPYFELIVARVRQVSAEKKATIRTAPKNIKSYLCQASCCTCGRSRDRVTDERSVHTWKVQGWAPASLWNALIVQAT